jgi:hypothetical protein
MKADKGILLTRIFSLFLAGLFFSFAVFAGDAPRITKEETKDLIGRPGVRILDARTAR